MHLSLVQGSHRQSLTIALTLRPIELMVGPISGLKALLRLPRIRSCHLHGAHKDGYSPATKPLWPPSPDSPPLQQWDSTVAWESRTLPRPVFPTLWSHVAETPGQSTVHCPYKSLVIWTPLSQKHCKGKSGNSLERPLTCPGPRVCYWEGRVWGSSSHLSLHPVIPLYSGTQLLLLTINCRDLRQFGAKGTVTSHNTVKSAAARS